MIASEIVLERFAYTHVGVFGRLYIPEFECYTVERPWLNNQRKVSCIPCGRYRFIRSVFHRGGYETFELTNVPARSLIKIHKGNTMDDVLGCIALGKGLGYISNKWAVTYSGNAFRTFIDMMANIDQGQIEIKNSDIC